jgi:hypothetical protein
MRVIQAHFALSAVAVLSLGFPAVGLANACILTPAKLQTLVGRAFNAGQESKAVDGSSVCSYTEVDSPKRRLVINVIESKADVRFESAKRLLKMSNKPIDLAGVGDAAYYNGTAAGVLSKDRMIAFSGVKPPPGSKPSHLAPEQIVALLKAALEQASK